MVKRLMAASMAGTLAVTMFAGCGGSSDSKDSSAKTEDTSEDNSDKPDTWIADRTITVQAYVDDIGNTLPKDFNNTETMKKITELTGIKLVTVMQKLWLRSWLPEPSRMLSYLTWITPQDRSSRFCTKQQKTECSQMYLNT